MNTSENIRGYNNAKIRTNDESVGSICKTLMHKKGDLDYNEFVRITKSINRVIGTNTTSQRNKKKQNKVFEKKSIDSFVAKQMNMLNAHKCMKLNGNHRPISDNKAFSIRNYQGWNIFIEGTNNEFIIVLTDKYGKRVNGNVNITINPDNTCAFKRFHSKMISRMTNNKALKAKYIFDYLRYLKISNKSKFHVHIVRNKQSYNLIIGPYGLNGGGIFDWMKTAWRSIVNGCEYVWEKLKKCNKKALLLSAIILLGGVAIAVTIATGGAAAVPITGGALLALKLSAGACVGAGINSAIYTVKEGDKFKWKEWTQQSAIGGLTGAAVCGASIGVGHLGLAGITGNTSACAVGGGVSGTVRGGLEGYYEARNEGKDISHSVINGVKKGLKQGCKGALLGACAGAGATAAVIPTSNLLETIPMSKTVEIIGDCVAGSIGGAVGGATGGAVVGTTKYIFDNEKGKTFKDTVKHEMKSAAISGAVLGGVIGIVNGQMVYEAKKNVSDSIKNMQMNNGEISNVNVSNQRLHYDFNGNMHINENVKFHMFDPNGVDVDVNGHLHHDINVSDNHISTNGTGYMNGRKWNDNDYGLFSVKHHEDIVNELIPMQGDNSTHFRFDVRGNILGIHTGHHVEGNIDYNIQENSNIGTIVAGAQEYITEKCEQISEDNDADLESMLSAVNNISQAALFGVQQ